jgi:Tfp pilus assembly protein PilF
MATGLRIRVTWDDTVIEDRIHFNERIFIGSGPLAHVVVPAQHGSYAVVVRRGAVFELRVAPNTMQSIEFPGEERIDGAQLDETLVREMKPPFGAGRLTVGGAVVEFERWTDEQPRDPLMAILTVGVAVLALQVGLQYKLVRLFGDGERPQWGRPPALSERDASRVRVRIGPDGAGASRPQAGLGSSLHGHASGNRLQPPQAELVRPEVQPPRQGRPKPPTDVRPGKHVAQGEEGTSPLQPVLSEKKEKSTGPQLSREQTIEEAQSALLAADLRKAIDSFSHAARQGPLDYDQLNWLGLAHYLAGDYGDATKEWEHARTFDAMRPDAINNLASVAKRKGDIEHELELLQTALEREPHDCHASNSLALALAKQSKMKEAEATPTPTSSAPRSRRWPASATPRSRSWRRGSSASTR